MLCDISLSFAGSFQLMHYTFVSEITELKYIKHGTAVLTVLLLI